MPATKDGKIKFTARSSELVFARGDEWATKLNLSRSDVVEQALELWLQRQSEQDDEQYFRMAAAEMNADAKSWNAASSLF